MPSSPRSVRHLLWIQLAIVVASCAAGAALSPRVAATDGIVWDGSHYADIARRPFGAIFLDGVPEYRLQRVLPSVAVGAALRLVGAARSDENVTAGFLALNALLTAAACVTWNRIARRLALGAGANWLGFLALFANVAMMRVPAFYPVLTDVAATTLGLVLLDLHLGARRTSLAVASIVGSFVWPLTSIYGAILLLLPARAPSAGRREPAPLATWLALLAAGLVTALCLRLFLGEGARHPGLGPVVEVLEAAVYPSILLSAGYVAWVVFSYGRDLTLDRVRGILREIRASDAMLAAAVVILPRLAVHAIGTEQVVLTPATFLETIVFGSVTRPGIWLVAHAVYFGPAVLLVALLWNDVRDAATRLGPGLVAAAALTLVLFISCESRQSSMGWPLLVLLLAVALDARGLATGRTIAATAALCVVALKPWMSLATAPEAAHVDEWSSLRPDEIAAAAANRHYFMNHGPYMLTADYVVQGAAMIVGAAILWRTLRANPNAPRA